MKQFFPDDLSLNKIIQGLFKIFKNLTKVKTIKYVSKKENVLSW